MNSSSQTGLYQSANSSTSTLRPRAARLISYIDDENSIPTNESNAVSTSSSSTSPRFPSRGVSDNDTVIRSRSTDKSKHGRTKKLRNRSSSGSQSPSSGGPALWDSWSSIQGLASTLLGSDVPGSSKDKTNGPFKAPIWMKQDLLYGTKSSTPQWGPSHQSPADAAQGALEERQAMVQAKRREELLLASVSENLDSSGRHKRRGSDADLSVATPTDSNEDALVYMHKVDKRDTMAGVIIKYNCQAEAFRKINRFWPNDSIQTRTHVLIPVEGSTVRGRKVDSPYLSRGLFDPGPDNVTDQTTSTSVTGETRPLSPNGMYSPSQSGLTTSSAVTSEPPSVITLLSEEIEFKHDSWVMIPNFSEAVEILRVPRRALGYFPRARRKSNATYTDTSTTSTPKSSFDMLRHPPTHAAQTSTSLNASPVRRLGVPPRPMFGRQRSSSATGGPGNSFVDALRGPGGVGNLRGLRTEISRPGPADDPLNRKFAQYLPDLLPPEDMPRTGFSIRPTPKTTPRASSDSIRSTRSNSNSSGFGEVSGAIEGWVRKMAGAKRERGAVVDKMGDLIELETNPDGESHHVNSIAGKSKDSATTPTAISPRTSAGVASTTASATEVLLNERFPIRGRVRNAYASASSSGKDKGD
ncbi:uncharacterized protein Z518_08245 [Rhinocladiella mackenziei CBS 650.93]|uniref:LysM domain-containing protein n=1 Tax=Rhinocladiella mackenziei CBS 650.93 TaxID=1442369 RepID=A0A0D2I8Y7_9EURO|nr:uncharacterized protein Z518_08245 [Rhinocladiella mackenziei CBS 650.93]KIX02304.1 hypothetical protein Z518_08245 [Rhinocladiella mackenziei CBS 650.93]